MNLTGVPLTTAKCDGFTINNPSVPAIETIDRVRYPQIGNNAIGVRVRLNSCNRIRLDRVSVSVVSIGSTI